MEAVSTTAFLAAALLACAAAFVFSKLAKTRAQTLPPGPRGFSALKTLLVQIGSLPYQAVKWSKEYKSDVVLCQLPIGNRLFLCSAKATRELYASKDTEEVTNDRGPSYPAQHFLQYNLAFQSPDNPVWSKQRKLLHSTLKFYGDGVARFESTVQQELKRVVTELEEKVGQDVVLKDVLGHSIINIMVILVTGKSSDTYPDLNKAIADYDNKLTNLLTMRFVIYMKLFPFLVYVPGTWFKRVWDAAVVSKKRLLKLAFEDMKASWVPGQPRGMTDIFFDEQRKEGRDWLTDEYVKGLVLDLLFAGTSTTLETLSSMFLFFLHHPDVVKNIQAEVDRVVGSREPRLEDRPRCSYTEAAILESMRFLTLLPLGVSHKARDEVQFRGFTIPKGTLIFSVSWAMNNSADVWGDPGTFRPERFLDDKGNLLEATHPVRQQHLNFGVGKRACPGEVFARARIFLYVTTLLQRFDILPPQTESLLPLDKDSWHMGGFRVVKKYRCIFRKRSLSE